MQKRSEKFLRRILAIHAVLLAVVLGSLTAATAGIYHWTRDDALANSRKLQEALANQTCAGIQQFYAFLISDLNWIQRGRGAPQSNSAPLTLGTTRPNSNPLRRSAPNRQFGIEQNDERTIGAELGGHVSALFAYNKSTATVVTSLLPRDSKLTADDLSQDVRDWLADVSETKVSRLMRFNNQGVSLVAAPFPNDPIVLVAVVPGQEIETSFLKSLSDQNSAGASLVDNSLLVVTSTNRKLTGVNLAQVQNSDLMDMIRGFQSKPVITTQTFTEPIRIGDQDLGPRMVTLCPVPIAQNHWMLVFAEPLGNIDAAINPIFKLAVFWALLVAGSLTAVLVSTAFQMIRWRARLETERHHVLERELIQARRIQQQWLPDIASAPRGMDVAATNQPANHISGDFYNWFELPNGKCAIVIGDVTGHGMAAAFLMATTQLLVRGTLLRIPDPGAAMEEVNRQLSSQMFRGQFVTMLILALDMERGTIDLASAGHPAPLVVRDGEVKPLEVEQHLVLGVESQVRYLTQRFSLPPSSGVLLYTDGIIDAPGPDGQRFGLRRLIASLDGGGLTAQETVEEVVDAAKEFRGNVELEDDLTLVALQWRRTVSATSSSQDQSAGGARAKVS